ncbi:sulfotransferase [Capilliphycus salinus ALCB114379]|uniref:sulfotransferase n=1 Tax=Capilliphycus salinus TaxID=2768948 RepID=UPI0039A62346
MAKFHQFIPPPIQPLYSKVRELRDYIEREIKTQRAKINPHPIIVLGNQKSGTSVIAALLGKLTNLSVTIDLYKEIDHPLHHQVIQGKLSFEEFVRLNKLDFSREIVKEPNLTLLYDNLLEYFPESQVVFVVRDPRDNLRSILNRLQLPGNLPQLNTKHWESMSPTWRLIIESQGLNLPGENYIERMAHRWNYMADLYDNHADRMILIRYEDFLKNKVGQIKTLAQELELKPSNDISDQVNIQFQSRGDRKVKWTDFFGTENLSKIESICNNNMKKLNY